MPRTAADATRFTATGPYAASKSSTGRIIPVDRSIPPNETPQQKIARLRAAAARAKLGDESQFDKVVRVGRVWADRAHRITAWSLIGLTVVCGVFASFAIGDMLIHNRRKRKEWLEEQQHKSATLLEAAREAATRGQATDDQILLLNRERAAQEAEAERKAQKGIFGRAKEAVVGSSAKEAVPGESNFLSEVRAARSDVASGVGAAQNASSGLIEGVMEKAQAAAGEVKSAIQHTKQSAVSATGSLPLGTLDRQAQASANAIKSASSGWFSWVSRS